MILVFVCLAFPKDNDVFLSIGYPGTMGIYYERNIKPLVIGIGPGFLFPLFTMPDYSYNPDLYVGYSIFGRSNFKTNFDIHGMYFYNYEQRFSGDGSKIRSDLILVGPDLAVQFTSSHFFSQLQLGTRSTFQKWFERISDSNLSFYKQLFSITFSGGVTF